MTIISPVVFALALAFIAVALVASVVSVAVIAQFVATNRRERLTRHQSVGTYYRTLALTH